MPYTFEGTELPINSEPQLKDGTMWVPLRALGQALGGSADWDPDNRVAILYLDNRVATLKVGDATADVDGEQIELQAAPYLDSGETWVPVRFFNHPLGYPLRVELDSKSVHLSNPVTA